jgi:hypothetical protein
MTALLDRLRRIPSLVSVILTAGALIVVFFLFFPDDVLLIAEGVAGIIAWLVGLMFGGWWLCIRFLLALVSALLLLATWCALRAWLQVRWTKHDAVWQFAGVPHIVLSCTIAVLLAVINEIILSLLSVPRCLGWIETSSRGQPHVELAGEQVDDCFEVAS